MKNYKSEYEEDLNREGNEVLDVEKRNNEEIMTVRKKKKRIIGFIVLGAILMGIIAVTIWIVPALTNPAAMFDTNTAGNDKKIANTAKAKEESSAIGAKSQESEAEKIELELEDNDVVSVEDMPPEITDITDMDDKEDDTPINFDGMINIALLGLDLDFKDYADDGGQSHTDAMIILSIDFNKEKVSLISLPRDSFTIVPGVQGFYKLNAAINIGGGNTEEGFRKACEVYSYVLGGVPIDYYVAFKFNTIKQLCDAIGGVDYYVEMEFVGPSHTEYKKGFQHLDAIGMYDYLRARKTLPYPYNQDSYRMERCRKLMVATFDKMKKENMLIKIPELLSMVKSGLYTNLTSRQIVALANFAANSIKTDEIGSYQLKPASTQIILGWKFVFLWDRARLEVIKEVYGFEAEPHPIPTLDFAKWLRDSGMETLRYLGAAKEVLNAASSNNTDEVIKSKAQELEKAINGLQMAYDEEMQTLKTSKMSKVRKEVKKLTEELAKDIEYSNELEWTVRKDWYNDPAINEIRVVFS